MRVVFTIAWKDLRLLWRDKVGLFFTLGFPLIMALFFGAISGGGGPRGKMKLAVDDREGTEASKRWIERLAGSDAVELVSRDADAARQDVRRGKLTAYLVVAPGGALELGVDPARTAEAGAMEALIAQATFDGPRPAGPRIERAAIAPDRVRPASAFEVTFPSGILWGVIGCVATFAVSMVVERTRGTLARLTHAPISRAQILAGKATACFVSCLGVVVVLLALGTSFFGVRLTNPVGLAIATLCTAICFVGITMFFSVLGKTENAVSGSVWGIMLPLSMIGGGMIPLFAMPRWMQNVSHASPVKWAILSLEGGIWRGFTIAELALPCGILVVVGVAAFTAGSWMVARR